MMMAVLPLVALSHLFMAMSNPHRRMMKRRMTTTTTTTMMMMAQEAVRESKEKRGRWQCPRDLQEL